MIRQVVLISQETERKRPPPSFLLFLTFFDEELHDMYLVAVATPKMLSNANSSLFVCDVEEFDENRFIRNFEKRGDKLDRIVLVKWGFLDRVQKDQTLLGKSIKVIEEPKSHSPKQRILG